MEESAPSPSQSEVDRFFFCDGDRLLDLAGATDSFLQSKRRGMRAVGNLLPSSTSPLVTGGSSHDRTHHPHPTPESYWALA